jgi:hypothetical protein
LPCYNFFGVIDDGRPVWPGNFEGAGFTNFDRSLLCYQPHNRDWWLGSFASGQLQWAKVGNTTGFGQVYDGRPIWTGNFTGGGASQLLFYHRGDHTWWLGSLSSSQLSWRLAEITGWFAQRGKARVFHVNDFTGAGGTDVLFYAAEDHTWWLGSFTGGAMGWSLMGNTSGFGRLDDGRPFWTGYFSNINRAEVLFYYPGDHNWWLGSLSGGQLNWNLVSNTSAFGRVDNRMFWIDDFNADFKSDLLMHDAPSGNWSLGTFVGGQLQWRTVGNTSGFGRLDDGRPFWTGYFRGVFQADILFYFPGDGNWWLGTLVGQNLTWSNVGNTAPRGDMTRFRFWKGFFKRQGGFDLLYCDTEAGDVWYLGSIVNNQLTWTPFGISSRGSAFPSRIRLHFKLLATPLSPVAAHFVAVRDLFGPHGILVEMGSVEDLRTNTTLDSLRDLIVADCQYNVWPWPSTTAAQEALFSRRDLADPGDIVIYIVRTIVASGETATPNVGAIGCATYPSGKPGAALERTAPVFVTPHEVGHVLGLGHIGNSDRLMFRNIGWTNLPPDVSVDEGSWMRGNDLTVEC